MIQLPPIFGRSPRSVTCAAPNLGELRVTLDIFAWIAHPEVPNPLRRLPGPVARFIPSSHRGPWFGGDGYRLPPNTAAAMRSRSWRTHQRVSLSIPRWGDAPKTVAQCIEPGTTTVLSARRRDGGIPLARVRALVKSGQWAAHFDPESNTYAITLTACACDPIPAAAARCVGNRFRTGLLGSDFVGRYGNGSSPLGRSMGLLGERGTPSLAWRMDFRLSGDVRPVSPVVAPTVINRVGGLGWRDAPRPTGLVLRGNIRLREFPSYVAYLTVDSNAGSYSRPILFVDAANAGLYDILRPARTSVLARL